MATAGFCLLTKISTANILLTEHRDFRGILVANTHPRRDDLQRSANFLADLLYHVSTLVTDALPLRKTYASSKTIESADSASRFLP